MWRKREVDVDTHTLDAERDAFYTLEWNQVNE
jgi:hypothetical protein